MSRSTTLRALLADSLRELSAVADRSGWEIWKVYEDAGISGAKGRDRRPGLEAMMKAVNAREFDMVAAWSVDRLGRSLGICSASCKTSTKRAWTCFFTSRGSIPRRPPGRRCSKCWVYSPSSSGASFGNGSTLASRARARGTKLGRRPVEPSVEARIRELRISGDGILKIGRKLGVGTSVVQRVVRGIPKTLTA